MTMVTFYVNNNNILYALKNLLQVEPYFFFLPDLFSRIESEFLLPTVQKSLDLHFRV